MPRTLRARHGGPTRIGAAVVCLAATLLAGACASRSPADPARLSASVHPMAIKWPERSAGWAEEELSGDGAEHQVWLTALRFTSDGWVLNFASMQAIFHEVVPRGRGVLARVSAPDPPPERPTVRDEAYFFYSSGTSRFPVDLFLGTAAPGVDPTARPISPVMFTVSQRTDVPEHRGLVLLFHGFGSDKYERPLIEAMRQRGWIVAETWMSLGLLFFLPAPDEVLASPERAGMHFAGRIDGVLSEWAYACDALLEHLAAADSGIADRPVVLVGCSAGGFGAPAAAALLREQGRRIGAAVLVGAGSDMVRVVHTSDLFKGGSDTILMPGRPLHGETLERLSAAYLDHSRLDPHHAAAALRDIPVLMLHSRHDAIVSASTGDALYERLGRPERWTFSIGHEMLFWRLPAYAGEIADWVDRMAGTSDRGPPNDPP